ncbi:uncharacterized protein LOC109835284 [Asparagus officinalis]|uniref:uncharacterized protein LOC109835284 n=1 Tax=Asparagus officinalis TaxID=4686 RepID=UPI00098E619A|nr:uncharacterized protein LOC109835284 [Asparagus officinalis]
MDRAKEANAKAFVDDSTKYYEVFDIIDKRWQDQLHRPLHIAGYYLNPAFFYDHPNIQGDDEVMKCLYQVIEKMVPTQDQDKIDRQLDIYRHVGGLFGIEIAKRNRKKKSLADWWESYGASAPELQKLAVRGPSLTCSSFGYERKWSTFEQIHTKKRNILDHKRLQDLYCKYNQALKEKFDCRDSIDPIKLADIYESNECLLGGIGSSSRRREPVSESEDEEEFNDEEQKTKEEDIPFEGDDDDVNEDD